MLYFLYPSALHRYLCDRDGRKTWAQVTGASDGIGEGFVNELCSHGFNVVLHGRNAEKLTRVQEALRAEYPKSEVHIAIADTGSLPPQPLMISSLVCKTSTERYSSTTSAELERSMLTLRRWKPTLQQKLTH
jgi:short subunit dehydrogenase-like uncharacterized protein